MVSRWAIAVDRTVCIGASVCANYAPEHFELRAGKSHPRVATTDPDEAVLDTAETCPVSAITVHDTDSGALLAPEE
ncbi:ferredoxin [Streptomyces sioyaensis]|uniref:Ferredoxin n=1 Tax=Streptomyces sioyaensis TaxID=67364 RepID=A0A4Q1QKV6_9ACTN|nr:ferredoxin [Streptomyces sioyaensis]MBM4796763.1 ferredoxin [Streptomyces sioyaensis]RXS59315.1 ferredoxin [Streptomyces sioyaensis]